MTGPYRGLGSRQGVEPGNIRIRLYTIWNGPQVRVADAFQRARVLWPFSCWCREFFTVYNCHDEVACETKSEDNFGEPRSLASGPAEGFQYLRRGLRGDRARGTRRLGLDKSSPDGRSGTLYPDGSQHGFEFCCSGTWPDRALPGRTLRANSEPKQPAERLLHRSSPTGNGGGTRSPLSGHVWSP